MEQPEVSEDFKVMANHRAGLCVVRVTTSAWANPDGLHIKKSLRFLRRKSLNPNILEEDLGSMGAIGVADRITNLQDVSDGVYRVITCDEEVDHETGYVDDYGYKLVPL